MYIENSDSKSNPRPQAAQPHLNPDESHGTSFETAESEAAYQKLLASFEQLHTVPDPVRAEFELIQLARSHKIPLSSFRKMLKAWLTQRETGGAS